MTTDVELEQVDQPAHYQGADGITVIDVIENYDLGFHLGSAIKYLLRADKKGEGAIDIAKARWCLARWLEHQDKMYGFDALAWRPPEEIPGLFGVNDPVVIKAVTLILEAGVYSDQVDLIELAIKAIDSGVVDSDREKDRAS